MYETWNPAREQAFLPWTSLAEYYIWVEALAPQARDDGVEAPRCAPQVGIVSDVQHTHIS